MGRTFLSVPCKCFSCILGLSSTLRSRLNGGNKTSMNTSRSSCARRGSTPTTFNRSVRIFTSNGAHVDRSQDTRLRRPCVLGKHVSGAKTKRTQVNRSASRDSRVNCTKSLSQGSTTRPRTSGDSNSRSARAQGHLRGVVLNTCNVYRRKRRTYGGGGLGCFYRFRFIPSSSFTSTASRSSHFNKTSPCLVQ